MMRSFLRQLVIGLTVAYALGVAALLVLRAFDSVPSFGGIKLLLAFVPWLFAPLLVCLPLALLLRSRALGALFGSGLMLFAILFGARFLPPNAPVPAERTFRVATFNVWLYNEDASAVTAAVLAQQADVVTLQEMSNSRLREPVEAALAERYPYRWFDEGTRLSVLSRYPFERLEPVFDTVSLRVRLDVQGTPVTLINAHLQEPRIRMSERIFGLPLRMPRSYDDQQRWEEAAEYLKVIDATDGPLIIQGDFNTSDQEPLYQEFAKRMQDAFGAVGQGFGHTFPNRLTNSNRIPTPVPLVRIDYVWVTGGLAPQTARVDCAGGSDHCVLVADVGFVRR